MILNKEQGTNLFSITAQSFKIHPVSLYNVYSKTNDVCSLVTNKHYSYSIEYKAVHCGHITKRNSEFISLFAYSNIAYVLNIYSPLWLSRSYE